MTWVSIGLYVQAWGLKGYKGTEKSTEKGKQLSLRKGMDSGKAKS